MIKHLNNRVYFDTKPNLSGDFRALNQLSSNTTYDTNLLYFSYSTGKITEVKLVVGPRHGVYLSYNKTKQNVSSAELTFYGDGTYSTFTGSGVLFISSYISKILPKLQEHCKKNVDMYTRYLNNWQSRLESLSTVADDYPEHFI